MAFFRSWGKRSVNTRASVPLGLCGVGVLAAALAVTGCDDGSGSGGILDGMREGPGVLRGTISIEPGTRIDRDTALAIIEQGSGLSRDDEDNPQYEDSPLSGTITLGGYVSGSSGEYGTGFPYPVDEEDVFRLNLEEGETVSLQVFSATGAEAPELMFELRSQEGEEDAQRVEGASASLVASQSGTHDLIIRADQGGDPARYTLRIEQTETTADSHTPQDFVPGEAVITTESLDRAGQIRAQSRAPVAARSQASLGGNRFRVQMPDAGQARLQAQSREQARNETWQWIRELEQTEGVASATPNYIMRRQFSEQSARNESWHKDLIQVDEVWEHATGEGVDLAVLDTGVLKDTSGDWHSGLVSNIDCSTGSCFDAIDGDRPVDDSGDFHGTHVSGIVAAAEEAAESGDSENHRKGIAYDANLIPVRVLDGSEGTLADVIAGIDWVVNGGNPRAGIMNLSLGGLNRSPALQSALDEAEQAGVVVTAAAGNRGDRLEFYPAAYPSVVAVGSVSCDSERSGFSSFGDWLTLSAPGGGNPGGCDESRVYSTFGELSDGEVLPTYDWLAGTSMAAPQVAGVFALMTERYDAGDLQPGVFRAMVREGLLTDPGGGDEGAFDLQTGRGVLNAEKAFADGLEPDEYAALAPDQDWLRLSDSQLQQSIRFERVGSTGTSLNDLEVSVVDEPDWLAEPQRTGTREFEVALSEDIAPGRFYQGLLRVGYTRNGSSVSYQIPVSAITEDAVENREAGTHFVQLIREEEFGQVGAEPAREVRAEFHEGRYDFEMDTSDLEPGDYVLIAGSDIDNNGVIGEVGEAYAVWTESGDDRGLTAPDPVRITRDMNRSVEMTASFLTADDTGVPAGRVLRGDRE